MRFVLVVLMSLLSTLATAKGEKPGDFDYFVLALSWSPSWCAIEGDARNAEQCDTDLGWSLHGLWPQKERGWPSYCPTNERAPSRRMTRDMADIMGSDGLAWHQWNKHGTCADMTASEYFEASRFAYDQIVRPTVFRKLDQPVKLPAKVIEEAFIKENPDLEPDMLTVTCKRNRIQEVRICLTKGLTPRFCGPDVVRDCSMDDALFAPIR